VVIRSLSFALLDDACADETVRRNLVPEMLRRFLFTYLPTCLPTFLPFYLLTFSPTFPPAYLFLPTNLTTYLNRWIGR
jgi:hypothetical protein